MKKIIALLQQLRLLILLREQAEKSLDQYLFQLKFKRLQF